MSDAPNKGTPDLSDSPQLPPQRTLTSSPRNPHPAFIQYPPRSTTLASVTPTISSAHSIAPSVQPSIGHPSIAESQSSFYGKLARARQAACQNVAARMMKVDELVNLSTYEPPVTETSDVTVKTRRSGVYKVLRLIAKAILVIWAWIGLVTWKPVIRQWRKTGIFGRTLLVWLVLFALSFVIPRVALKIYSSKHLGRVQEWVS